MSSVEIIKKSFPRLEILIYLALTTSFLVTCFSLHYNYDFTDEGFNWYISQRFYDLNNPFIFGHNILTHYLYKCIDNQIVFQRYVLYILSMAVSISYFTLLPVKNIWSFSIFFFASTSFFLPDYFTSIDYTTQSVLLFMIFCRLLFEVPDKGRLRWILVLCSILFIFQSLTKITSTVAYPIAALSILYFKKNNLKDLIILGLLIALWMIIIEVSFSTYSKLISYALSLKKTASGVVDNKLDAFYKIFIVFKRCFTMAIAINSCLYLCQKIIKYPFINKIILLTSSVTLFFYYEFNDTLHNSDFFFLGIGLSLWIYKIISGNRENLIYEILFVTSLIFLPFGTDVNYEKYITFTVPVILYLAIPFFLDKDKNTILRFFIFPVISISMIYGTLRSNVLMYRRSPLGIKNKEFCQNIKMLNYIKIQPELCRILQKIKKEDKKVSKFKQRSYLFLNDGPGVLAALELDSFLWQPWVTSGYPSSHIRYKWHFDNELKKMNSLNRDRYKQVFLIRKSESDFYQEYFFTYFKRGEKFRSIQLGDIFHYRNRERINLVFEGPFELIL